MRTTPYPHDQAEIESLGPSRQDFEAWMAILEHEHQAAGSPYGSPGEDAAPLACNDCCNEQIGVVTKNEQH